MTVGLLLMAGPDLRVAIFLLFHGLARLGHLLGLALGHDDRRSSRIHRLELERATCRCRAFIAHKVIDLGLKAILMVLLRRVVPLMPVHLRILGPRDALFLLRLGGRRLIR